MPGITWTGRCFRWNVTARPAVTPTVAPITVSVSQCFLSSMREPAVYTPSR